MAAGTDMAAVPDPLTGGTARDVRERLNAERDGGAHLVFRDDERRQRILDLQALGDQATIGRSEAADVSLAWDLEVSRVHATLARVADQWVLCDDGMSMNGTYVNDERVRGRSVLRDRDVIRMGESFLVFRHPRERTLRTTKPSPGGPGVSVTPAQRRVLVELCRPFAGGRRFATAASNAEIAEALHLSVDAVKGHVRLLFRAFGVDDVDRERRRAALAERAFETGTVGWQDFGE